METDLIVVGAGVAGAALCLELRERGWRPLWLTSPRRPATSLMAGALLHAGRARVNAPDPLLASALPEAVTRWQAVARDHDQPGLFRPTRTPTAPAAADPPTGPESSATWWLEPAGLLGRIWETALAAGWARACHLPGGDLGHRLDALSPRPAAGTPVVWCLGWHLHHDPAWQIGPRPLLKPARGQVLELSAQPGDEPPDEPGQLAALELRRGRGIWAVRLPLPAACWRVGASTSWDLGPDEDAALALRPKETQWLLERLPDLLLGQEASVLRVMAGVRPASFDRRPLIGRHPRLSGHWVLNGLGGRGWLLAPMAARFLADALEGGSIPREFDLRRLHSPGNL